MQLAVQLAGNASLEPFRFDDQIEPDKVVLDK